MDKNLFGIDSYKDDTHQSFLNITLISKTPDGLYENEVEINTDGYVIKENNN